MRLSILPRSPSFPRATIVALAALIAFLATAAPSPAAHGTYSNTLGYSGPAGLYAYGMAYDATDNTVLVGNYLLNRVERYTADGAFIGIVSRNAPKDAGGGITTPYGVTADPDHNGTWIRTIGRGGTPDYPFGCGGGKLNVPTYVAVERTSRIVYVSDPKCGQVYAYSPTGTFLFEFDWAPAGLGVSPKARGVAEGPDGLIYVAEYKTRRIVVFDQAGNWIRNFPVQTDLADVRGIAIDQEKGFLYAVSAFYNRVVQFRLDGTFVRKWSGDGTTAFDSVRYVAAEGGKAWIGDTWGYVVWKFDSGGNRLPWSTPRKPPPNGGYNLPMGVAVSPAGRVFVVDQYEHRVQAFDSAKTCPSRLNCPAWLFQFGKRGEDAVLFPAGLSYPRTLDFGGGYLWLGDGGGNNDIKQYTADGTFVGQIGSAGTAPGRFSGGVYGLRYVNGVIYATDVNNCRLQLFDSSTGSLLKYMGGCGDGPNQMRGPQGLDVDGNKVYVAEPLKDRISVWNTDTKLVTQVLMPTCEGLSLSDPLDVILDPSNTYLYVADTLNARVVRMRPNGTGCEIIVADADVPGGKLGNPRYLAFGPDGRLYVSTGSRRVYAFTVPGPTVSPTNLTYTRDVGVSQTAQTSPVDIGRSPSGNWFVIDEGQACLEEYEPTDLSAPVRTFFTCGTVGKDTTHISRARGLGIDPTSGAVWIADTSNHRVLKLDPATGTLLVNTSVAGAAGGPLSSPGDVAVDGSGNAYVIDQKDRVVKLDSSGAYVTQWGSSGNGVGQMRNPMSIAFSSVGGNALYVTDSRNFQVDKWSPSGSLLASFGSAGTGNGKMTKDARGIAVDSTGIVYVADVGGNRVIRFAANGSALTSLGGGLPYGRNGPLDIFYGARGLWVDGNRLAVTDMWGYRVLFWTLSGASTGQQIGGGAVPCSADLVDFGPAPPCNGHNEPRGLAFDADGNLYVSDYWHQWIQKFSPNGTLLAHWGRGRGSDPGTLNLVAGLAVDNARGYLYIANRENRHVDRWNLSDGSFNMRFPMPAGPAFVEGWPRDVAVDEATGRIYAADEKNNQFVIFSPASTTPVAVIRRHGTGAGQPLGPVYSLAWDSAADVLYVADYSNRMIHVYEGDGSWLRSFPVTGTPNGVEVANGIVYVMTYRLSMYDTNGTPLATFGSTGGGDSQFFQPYGGVAVSPTGEVVIADSGNHRVKVFSPS
jgi:sugar lactone lactonase YvrE